MTNDITYVHSKYKIPEKPSNIIYISYSQFSSYFKCNNYWKLTYIDKIKDKKDTIHTVFGNAMHRIIQEWVKILYTEKVKDAEAYDFAQKFKEYLTNEYKNAVIKNSNVHFSNKDEILEFYTDGLSILKYMLRKRTLFFDRKNEELIGIEMPIYAVENGVCLIAYLDLVFRNKFNNKIIIRDLKTSKAGWKKWDKENEIKVSQLILYKIYLSKQYNIPLDDINVEYIILKRKVPADSAYPIPRISTFSPANGKVSQNKVIKKFTEFTLNCFINGNYNTNREYVPMMGDRGFNCTFCEFANREDLCPKHKRT